MKKKILLLLILQSLISQPLWALTLSLNIVTAYFVSKEEALKEAKKIAAEVAKGKNKTAMSDAALECPDDNSPQFLIKSFQIGEYWIPEGSDFAIRYAGQINYTLKCNQ